MQEQNVLFPIIVAAAVAWFVPHSWLAKRRFYLGLVSFGVGIAFLSLGILLADAAWMQTDLAITIWTGTLAFFCLFGILLAVPAALTLMRKSKKA